MKPPRLYIKDDNGLFWYYQEDKILCDDGIDGYYCDDFESGYRLLIGFGYITPQKEQEDGTNLDTYN
jgi:hypothetical protein